MHKLMDKWSVLPLKGIVEETIKNLLARNIHAFFFQDSFQAKEKIHELIPSGSKVLASTSRTLDEIGLTEEIENSGKYVSVRKEYMALDHQKDADKIRILRSTPDLIIGSVHAVTRQGEVLIASNTGSQLAAYAAGAKKVIWVVGTQKITDNLEAGEKRIFEYVLPLESERLKKLHGVESNISKLLRYDKEVMPGRVTLIFVNEILGF